MRYVNEPRAWVPSRDGSSVEIVIRRPKIWNDQPYVSYRMTSADTMTSMAFSRYGSPEQYWIIADMNPSIHCPDDARAGMVVNVPIVIS